MRSPFQQKLWEEMWESLDGVKPEPEYDWIFFDGYEAEFEDAFGPLDKIEIPNDKAAEIVEQVAGIKPIEAVFSNKDFGIRYSYYEDD